MLLNTIIPDFSLPDTAGRMHTLSAYRGRLVVLNFWSAECPWSARADAELLAFQREFATGLLILPVASNLNETPELIHQAAQERGLDFVLLDTACALADACGAETTPHIFVIDPAGILRYQGAVDDVTFRNRTPRRFYAREALSALLVGRLPEIQQAPPYGCTIVRNI